MNLDISLSRAARARIFLTRVSAWLREPVYFAPRSRIRVAVLLVLLGVIAGYAGSAWYDAHTLPAPQTVPLPQVSVGPGKPDPGLGPLPLSGYERVPSGGGR